MHHTTFQNLPSNSMVYIPVLTYSAYLNFLLSSFLGTAQTHLHGALVKFLFLQMIHFSKIREWYCSKALEPEGGFKLGHMVCFFKA